METDRIAQKSIVDYSDDPMFAAIEAHRQAYTDHFKTCCTWGDTRTDGPLHAVAERNLSRAAAAEDEAAWAFAQTVPETYASAAAALEYFVEFCGPGGEDRVWPEQLDLTLAHSVSEGLRKIAGSGNAAVSEA